MKQLKIEHRHDFGNVLNDMGLVGAGAEVGCAYGGYAEIVLSNWKGRKYFMVDLWDNQPTDVYREDQSTVNFKSYWKQCSGMAENDSRISLIREASTNAASYIADNSLDFVYIDANHSYEAVFADMNAWWSKVKSGGVFSGHDYYNDTNFPNFCEAKKAVDHWMSEHKFEFTTTSCSSWWFIKP